MNRKLVSFMLALCVSTLALPAFSQNKKIYIPDIPGYKTLKSDFHMHTVYSDGSVWPNFRAFEAMRDGMDVIAMTDHIEKQAFPNHIAKDYNQPYEIAKSAADNSKSGLIVIRGGEISPSIPPYHNNAIFLKDVNKLPTEYAKNESKKSSMTAAEKRAELMAPFLEAQKQGAFVFYNHPGYISWLSIEEKNLFTSIHEDLFKKGILKGVEVVNGGYNINAHRIAEKYNLTLIGNSDVHADLEMYRDTHRPMTLVFAKEKTEEAVKEALLARRTAVYVDDYIIARQPEAEALFNACVTATVADQKEIDGNREAYVTITLENKSDLKFDLRVLSAYNVQNYPMGKLVLMPREKKDVTIGGFWTSPVKLDLKVHVYNIIVTPDKSLETDLVIKN